MQGRSHATSGARAIGTRRPAPAWCDAFQSILLVGTSTATATVSTEDRPIEGTLRPDYSPVDVARAWLADPAHTARVPAALLDCARRTLVIADSHFHELDELAGRVAADAASGGVIDDARIRQLDALAGTLEGYAHSLRRLLDPEATDPADAERRIRSGLRAADAGGGLQGLVVAL